MTQPQNPNTDPLLARIDKNPTGADLIQVVNTAGGQGIVYRINQFQAIWYVGSGNPIFIPGELPTNLFLDNLTGHIWQLGFDFIWRLLPSGGGGGGGSTVQTLSTTQGTITGAFDGVNNMFTLNQAPDTPTDLMVFLNGIYQVQGTDYTLAGSVVTLTVTPDVGGELVAIIDISTESLVNTLSSTNGTITGTFNGINTVFNLVITPSATPNTALFLNGVYQIQGTDYTMVSSTITMTIPPILGDQLTAVISTSGSTGGGVISLSGLLGVINLVAGANTSISVAGQNITISSTGGTTGVPSVNSITGPVTIKAGTGVSVATSSPNVTISATNTANVSWLDVQGFGGSPKPGSFILESTSAITTGGSPHVTLGTSLHFTNGEGVCIWKAGPPTLLQIAPAAPTATSTFVQGGQTITYKVAAFDNYGGISATSPQVQVTNAPAVFGPPPQAISSISQTANVVTVNFGVPLNTSVTAGMTLHITGMGSVSGHVVPGDAIFNGIWTIASAPTTSQVTFALNGNYGSGVVGPNTLGRVSNVQLITAISRNASGLITITTGQSNNSVVSNTNHPTVVIVENCFPTSLNGQYNPVSISGTTITCQTGNLNAVTGTVVANGDTTQGFATSASTATVYEAISVVCPTLAATDALQSPPLMAPVTCGYYIYSDSPNPGGALVLIGKTIGGNSPTTGNVHYVDWGPCQSSGYTAPGYVPTTPPVSAQNQMFTSFILSGQGTTSLTLTTNVTTGVTSTIRHDDAPSITAAFAATINGLANAVLMSPPLSTITSPSYIINSPVTTAGKINFVVGCEMIVNETMSFGSGTQVSVIPGAVGTTTPIFGQRDYVLVSGIGNPMVAGNASFTVDGIAFETQTNNQIGVIFSGLYSQNTNCSFSTQSTTGVTVPLVYQNATAVLIENINFSSFGRFANITVVGQSCFGPPIGSVWFRTTDNPNLNVAPPAQVTFSGTQTMAGRGILFDSFGAIVGQAEFFSLGDTLWNQAATTPSIMFVGANFSNVKINNVLNDTSECAVLANWTTTFLANVVLNSGVSNGFPVVTGVPITGLQVAGVSPLNQSENVVQVLTGTANIGSLHNAVPQSSKSVQAQPMDLGTQGSVFAKTKVTGLTASASGSGSFPTATWTVQVSCLCWDGSESELSDLFTINPNPNGSQGISASWNAVSGIQGYLVYLNGSRQSNVPLTTNSVFYSFFNNQGGVPTLGVSGSLVVSPLNGGTVVTPNLIIPSGVNKITTSAPTLTGNRTISLADGAQSTILSTSFTTTTSGSPYTITLQGATSSSHAWLAPLGASAASDGMAYVISVGTNQVVVNTSGNAGETFNVFATVN